MCGQSYQKYQESCSVHPCFDMKNQLDALQVYLSTWPFVPLFPQRMGTGNQQIWNQYWYLLVSQFSIIFFKGPLQTRSQKSLGSIMENLSTSWLIIWSQVTNKILFVWGPMNSCVKPLRSKMILTLSYYIYIYHLCFGSQAKT